MYTFRIAMRYLFSKKSHNAVNIISIVSILGVAVATAAIVCVLSVFNGFSDLAVCRLSRIDPQVKVTPMAGKTIEQADSIAQSLTRLKEVAVALPTVSDQAVAIYRGSQMAIEMRGVPKGYTSVTDIRRTIIDGDYLTSEIEIPVATLCIGASMRLRAYPGSRSLLSVYVPKRIGRINTANPMASFRSDSLFVGGVFNTENSDADAQTVFLPIETVRNLLDYEPSQATAIEITLAPGVSDSDGTAAIKAALPQGVYEVKDRLQQEAESFRMISVEKWITFVMLSFILIIASFNVISSLSMLIIEKKQNMQTLHALGATTPMIRRIFVWEGWLISVVGGVVGILLGVGLSIAQQIGGFIKLNGDPNALSITEYPVRVAPTDIGIVMLLVVAVGLLVGIITSRFAR